jgi:hypothetical protein
MSVYTTLVDANVLFPASMRDIFLQLAVIDIYLTLLTQHGLVATASELVQFSGLHVSRAIAFAVCSTSMLRQSQVGPRVPA